MKTVVALVLMMLTGVAAAQINKCVDKSGKVVGYGNECPAGTGRADGRVRHAGSACGGADAKSLVDRDADFRKRLGSKRQEADAKSKQARRFKGASSGVPAGAILSEKSAGRAAHYPE